MLLFPSNYGSEQRNVDECANLSCADVDDYIEQIQ